MRGGKEPRAEIALLIVGQPAAVGEDDEGGEVVRQPPQRITHPRPDTGKSREHEARIHEVAAGAVHVRPGDHRHAEGHLIHAAGEMRQQTADPPTRFAMPAEFEGRLENLSRFAGGGLDAITIAGIKRLAVPAEQRGLVVEQIHLARPAVHEQLDHPPNPGPVMAAPRQPRTVAGCPFSGGCQSLVAQQPAQGGAAKTAAELPQEVAAGSRPVSRKGRLHGADQLGDSAEV